MHRQSLDMEHVAIWRDAVRAQMIAASKAIVVIALLLRPFSSLVILSSLCSTRLGHSVAINSPLLS